jgi:hypothetical protein
MPKRTTKKRHKLGAKTLTQAQIKRIRGMYKELDLKLEEFEEDMKEMMLHHISYAPDVPAKDRAAKS